MASSFSKHVARRLKHYRKQQGLSLTEFAKKAGVRTSRYKNIELGQTEIGIHVLWRLVDAAGVHSASIFESAPTVREFFNKKAGKTPDWLLEIFERVEQEALHAHHYWRTYMVKQYPRIGELMYHILEAELS